MPERPRPASGAGSIVPRTRPAAVRARLAVALACFGLSAAARAGDPCTGAAWPLDVELGWLRAPAIESLSSGARLASLPSRALTLALVPEATAALPTSPSGKPHAGARATFAGFVTLTSLPAGVYQVTLAGLGWTDVVQHGAALAAVGHSDLPGCPALRESVRFRVAAGDAVLELSGVPTPAVTFAMRRVGAP